MTARSTIKIFKILVFSGVLVGLNCLWFLIIKPLDLTPNRDQLTDLGSSATAKIGQKQSTTQCESRSSNITIAVVVCGNRLEQTIITIKSAIIFSNESLKFIIFSDDDNLRKLATVITEDIPANVRERINFEIHPVSFPNTKWRTLFKLCASQRLFFTKLLNHTDSVIYVDNDVLFLTPVEQLWKFFGQMTANQLIAVVPEQEDYTIGWYNRFAKHPFVKPLGINSGVMLMNLTRMRSFNWDGYLNPTFEKYKHQIVFGDQDIINIIFHNNTDKLFMLPCKWNYRPDHCIYGEVCESAKSSGPKVIHGSRNVFFSEKTLSFKTVYDAIRDHSFSSSQLNQLLNRLDTMQPVRDTTNCGQSYPLFLKSLKSVHNS